MDTGVELLGIVAAACFAAAGLVLARVHMLPTGRDPMSEAISDYGVGAYHAYYRATVALLGVGAATLTAGLASEGGADNAGLAFLAAYAAARIAIAFFMTDPAGRPMSTEGRVHLVLAAVAFTTIAFAAGDVTGALDGEPGWAGTIVSVLRFEAHAIAITAVGTAGCFLLPALRERAFGLIERALYVASLAWLLTASIHLAVHAAG